MVRQADEEVSGTDAVHTVANCDDSVELIHHDRAYYSSAAFLLNCFHFGNSCFFLQLSRLKDIGKMLADGKL